MRQLQFLVGGVQRRAGVIELGIAAHDHANELALVGMTPSACRFTPATVGERGGGAAFLIVQHGSEALQKDVLQGIEPLARSGQIKPL